LAAHCLRERPVELGAVPFRHRLARCRNDAEHDQAADQEHVCVQRHTAYAGLGERDVDRHD